MTATSSHAFRVRFPEFADLADSLVTAKIGEAQRRCDAGLWGSKYQDGVFYLAAHLLAISPFGQDARLSQANNETVYYSEHKRLQSMVATGARVI